MWERSSSRPLHVQFAWARAPIAHGFAVLSYIDCVQLTLDVGLPSGRRLHSPPRPGRRLLYRWLSDKPPACPFSVITVAIVIVIASTLAAPATSSSLSSSSSSSASKGATGRVHRVLDCVALLRVALHSASHIHLSTEFAWAVRGGPAPKRGMARERAKACAPAWPDLEADDDSKDKDDDDARPEFSIPSSQAISRGARTIREGPWARNESKDARRDFFHDVGI